MSLSVRLGELQKRHGVTARRLAEYLDISPSLITRLKK